MFFWLPHFFIIWVLLMFQIISHVQPINFYIFIFMWNNLVYVTCLGNMEFIPIFMPFVDSNIMANPNPSHIYEGARETNYRYNLNIACRDTELNDYWSMYLWIRRFQVTSCPTCVWCGSCCLVVLMIRWGTSAFYKWHDP